jgi:hypothetical protein
MDTARYDTGMNEKRSFAVPVAVAILLILPIAAYVGGYFALNTSEQQSPNQVARAYCFHRVAAAYSPMARLERLVTGKPVVLLHEWNELGGTWGQVVFYAE